MAAPERGPFPFLEHTSNVLRMCRMSADSGTMDHMNRNPTEAPMTHTELLARNITLSRARYLESKGTNRHAFYAWANASNDFRILTGHDHPLGRRS